ncbi:protein kinase [bacterium]|nr:protein kinase [bacterium]
MIDRDLRARERALLVDAEDPNAHLRLGLALMRTGDLDAARAALVRAKELAPRREAPSAALRELLVLIAARDVPDADGLVAEHYRARHFLRAVNDETPLRSFLATDLRKMRRVVLRVRSFLGRGPEKPEAADPDSMEHLGVRLEPARQLRHPNVAALLDLRSVDVVHRFAREPWKNEHRVLVSEFRPEPTLDRLIALGPMEPARAAVILRQVLLACEAAHRRGLLHRLLSPRKIHLGEGDRARVRDFGLAVFLGETGKGRGLLGTAVLAYAPPEVLVAGPCDRRADLYAAGAIAWAMLAGAPPFRRDSKRDGIRSILSETPGSLPAAVRAGLPRPLEDLVMRLLAREPDDRPADARAAIEELDAAVPAPRAVG